MGGQDSPFQFLVLPALIVPDVADQRGEALHDGHGQPVEDLVVPLLLVVDVAILKAGLSHAEPDLRLV
jgi:hypothetical protein